jgi:hypothetical protein
LTRRLPQKRVPRHQAEQYRRVGSSLLDSAAALETIASDDDRFGNAIAIVAIHASIAYADALSIAYREVKSSSGDHAAAADVLRDALGPRADHRRIAQLRSVLGMKDRVSYTGSYFATEAATRLLAEARTFCGWAEELYAGRPVA